MAEKKNLWNTQIMGQALVDSLRKLDPRWMVKNPVMFVVEVGSVLTTALLIVNALNHRPGFGFNLQITLWLWFTVLFANFAEAMAEGRGKAQADTLRKAKGETIAKRYKADGGFEQIASGLLRAGDVIFVEAGSYIAGDGEVIDGHLRLKAARKLEITEIPIIRCDEWTQAQVKAFRILVNRSATWAEWDNELLALELD